jgi:putative endonuclease
MTSDIQKRLKDHNSGKSKSTKPYKSWGVIHKENFQDRVEARKREKYLKTAAGRRWSNQNIHPK